MKNDHAKALLIFTVYFMLSGKVLDEATCFKMAGCILHSPPHGKGAVPLEHSL